MGTVRVIFSRRHHIGSLLLRTLLGSAWSRCGIIAGDDVIEAVPAVEAPKVSPVQFKLLFTPQERVAIKIALATDPVIEDFFSIVDDPRLTFVDLGLQSTQDAIAYLVAKELITEARKAEILSGLIK